MDKHINLFEERIYYFNKLNDLILNFDSFFTNNYVQREKSVKISSDIDSSVHFIGSHISVFKKYLLNNNIPKKGIFMHQNCIRTQNLNTIYNEENIPPWASHFPSLGILYPLEKINELYEQLFTFLSNIGINDNDIKLKISSNDSDLMKLCLKNHKKNIIKDTEKESYYRHKIGINDIIGRNFNILLKNTKTHEFTEIGNFIVLEKTNVTIGVEVALGGSNIIKQLYGLNHVLDCYPINKFENLKQNIQRKLEDAILVSTVLFHENLKPNNHKGKGRMLYGYLKSINYYVKKYNIPYNHLDKIISDFELIYYPSETPLSNKIIKQISKYKSFKK